MDEDYSESVDTSPDVDMSSDIDVSSDVDTSDVVDDAPADFPEDIPEDVPEDITEGLAEDIPEDIPEDVPEDVPEDAPEDIVDDIPEDIPEDVSEDAAEGLAEDIPEDIPEDVPEDVPEDAPEDIVDDIPEDIPEDASEDRSEDVSEVSAEDIPEDIPEDVPEDVPEDAPEDVADDIPEDISEDAPEDSFEDVSEESTEGIPEEAPKDATDTETADETAEDTDGSAQLGDVADTEDTDEVSDTENSDTTEQPKDATDTETADETAEDTDASEQLGDAADTEDTDEATDSENSDTTEQPEDVTDANDDDADHSDLETYDYETSPETKDAVNPETSGEFVSADNPYRERWEKFEKEFSEKDVPLSGEEQSDTDASAEGSDSISSLSASKAADINNPSKETNESSDNSQDVVNDKVSEYNKTLKDFCENNGYAKNADFSDFDPRVSYDLAKSVVDAKKDFPDLNINYLGSIDNQVKGLHDTVEAAQLDLYKQSGFDESLAQQMAKQYADDFIKNSKLDDTAGTYAWSLETGNPTLDKYDGVAVNSDYAKDYTKFNADKQADEIAKWAPVGCGSPKAVMDHELGHEIDRLLDASNDTTINNLYSDMMKDNKAEESLSGYSRTNVKEFIAEAYSEYRNNPNPRDVSKAVYNRLIELRDQNILAKKGTS